MSNTNVKRKKYGFYKFYKSRNEHLQKGYGSPRPFRKSSKISQMKFRHCNKENVPPPKSTQNLQQGSTNQTESTDGYETLMTFSDNDDGDEVELARDIGREMNNTSYTGVITSMVNKRCQKLNESQGFVLTPKRDSANCNRKLSTGINKNSAKELAVTDVIVDNRAKENIAYVDKRKCKDLVNLNPQAEECPKLALSSEASANGRQERPFMTSTPNLAIKLCLQGQFELSAVEDCSYGDEGGLYFHCSEREVPSDEILTNLTGEVRPPTPKMARRASLKVVEKEESGQAEYISPTRQSKDVDKENSEREAEKISTKQTNVHVKRKHRTEICDAATKTVGDERSEKSTVGVRTKRQAYAASRTEDIAKQNREAEVNPSKKIKASTKRKHLMEINDTATKTVGDEKSMGVRTRNQASAALRTKNVQPREMVQDQRKYEKICAKNKLTALDAKRTAVNRTDVKKMRKKQNRDVKGVSEKNSVMWKNVGMKNARQKIRKDEEQPLEAASCSIEQSRDTEDVTSTKRRISNRINNKESESVKVSKPRKTIAAKQLQGFRAVKRKVNVEISERIGRKNSQKKIERFKLVKNSLLLPKERNAENYKEKESETRIMHFSPLNASMLDYSRRKRSSVKKRVPASTGRFSPLRMDIRKSVADVDQQSPSHDPLCILSKLHNTVSYKQFTVESREAFFNSPLDLITQEDILCDIARRK